MLSRLLLWLLLLLVLLLLLFWSLLLLSVLLSLLLRLWLWLWLWLCLLWLLLFEVCRHTIQRNQFANGHMLKVYTKTYATKKNMYNFSAKHTWRSSKVLKHRKSGLTIIKSDSRVTC